MIVTFIFSNKANGLLSLLSFSKQIKHVSVALYDGKYHYELILQRHGASIRHLNLTPSKAFDVYCKQESTQAVITVDIPEPHKYPWCPILIHTCNEVSRKFARINLSFCYSPFGLYRKLLKYDKINGYTILAQWRCNDGK